MLEEAADRERQRQSLAARQRLDEARTINKSLSALGNVISALTPRSSRGAIAAVGHVPYRDSKLTQILSQALGGNARTVLVVTFSMASCDVQETLSSLRFGSRTKRVDNRPVANVRQTPSSVDGLKTRVVKQEAEIKRLTALLEEKEACETPLSQPSTQCSSRMSWSPRSTLPSARSSLGSQGSERAVILTAEDEPEEQDGQTQQTSDVAADTRAQQAYCAALSMAFAGCSPSPPRSGEFLRETDASCARAAPLAQSSQQLGRPQPSPQSSPLSSPLQVSRALSWQDSGRGSLRPQDHGVHPRSYAPFPVSTTPSQGGSQRSFSPYRQLSLSGLQRTHSPMRPAAQGYVLLRAQSSSVSCCPGSVCNPRSESPGSARRQVSNPMIFSPVPVKTIDPGLIGHHSFTPVPANQRSYSPLRFTPASSCMLPQQESLVVRTPSAPARQRIPVPLEVVRPSPSPPATPASKDRGLPLCRWQPATIVPDGA